MVGVLVLAPVATAAPPEPDDPAAPYRAEGLGSPAERSEVARSGVDVLGGGRNHLEVRASDAEAAGLRARGLELLPLPELPLPRNPFAGQFPPGYTGYHTYDELLAELDSLAAAHPDRVAASSYGESFEGRELPLVKVSDNVAVDEAEPEVLFTCNQHAREHLTAEMCLRIVERLAADPQLVDDREVWVMPMTNPDGAEHDIASGAFALWRKNRQPNEGTPEVGTDLNRNWGTEWGCCDGSSGDPGNDTYRGAAPFSAPETAQLRDWVDGRVIGGEQQITAHIDWHTFSELVLWPYGYTESDTAPGLDADDAATFRELGEAMADTNGYTPQQSSDLYITDGGVNDWMWAEHDVWSFTFEMYPESQAEGGFYPPDSVIERETARNDDAVDLLLQRAADLP
ncbi:MAG: zinc carboxypeptidase [Pseudonocardiaceae bacterium]|nr:zinc carboxypeptidase [Pseudonocardiaceae bacterium]